jgi:NAD(P)-dependent dehydrogenase (short-subunit alcohol dehydrogenase family)
MTKPLSGKIALVAGATRGAGRGIARMLGEAGATVYCSGRSSRTQPNTSDHHYAGRPETIEETAEMVTAAGGRGIAVRVDHSMESEVESLIARIAKDHKRLDILVNVLTGKPVGAWSSFWEIPVAEGRAMFDGWVWPHVLTCRHAVPLMMKGKSGLMVEIIEQDTIGFHGQFYFDLFEIALKRMVYTLGEELAPHNISTLAITPGFMRTEAILQEFGVTEANWRDAAENNAKAKAFGFIASETPCYLGRCIAALAADKDIAKKSGGVYSTWGLSEQYPFTDLDGSRPHMGRYFKEKHPEFLDARTATGLSWKLVRDPA